MVNKKLRGWSSKFWKNNDALDIIKEVIDPNEIDISSIQIHDNLNPLIWDENDHMKSDVRKVLLKNAKEFIEFSDVENLNFNDIILTGSLANYNYNENSDLDVHIILDFNQISENIDFVGDFLKLKKQLWADNLPIQVKGYDVEMYFQNNEEPHQSTGIYSIFRDQWITKPTKKIINIDTANLQLKSADLMNQIDNLEKNKNSADFSSKYKRLKDKIKKYRQTGLNKIGEYSIENLVFKVLRNTGYLKKMVDIKNEYLTKELSLTEFINETINKLLNESVNELFFEKENEITINILSDFLFRNNENMSKNIPWKVIPFGLLKKTWEDYMLYGFVRNESPVETIEDIMIDNIIKINVITTLAGHTSSSPEDDFENNIGYQVDEYLNNELNDSTLKKYLDKYMNDKYYQYGYTSNDIVDNVTNSDEQLDKSEIRNELYENLKEKFLDYYIEDPKSGQAYLSDYGLEPLLKNLYNLMSETNVDKKIPIMDRILNVVHPRSDIASWFVERGSSSLNKLSGYETTEKPIEFNQYGSNINNRNN